MLLKNSQFKEIIITPKLGYFGLCYYSDFFNKYSSVFDNGMRRATSMF
jgi:hypothetical protein